MEYLYILQQAIIWIITVFWLYQLLISICSFVKLKDKPMLINKNHKFMAIIPAHNEEAVIANLVESLKKQDYPKELFDIYVIADNCTDKTKVMAENAGAIVYEREDSVRKNKRACASMVLSSKNRGKCRL
ncbi:MAG: glycosyltransferase [Clostridia bacterium]|nr:glycosyltransferase [Clostridia bacterium]